MLALSTIKHNKNATQHFKVVFLKSVKKCNKTLTFIFAIAISKANKVNNKIQHKVGQAN